MTNFLNRLKLYPFFIMSHRGFWGGNIIENSIESAQLAYKAGADIVEVDCCRTSDGEYYLFHDGNEPNLLRRTENFTLLTSKEVDEAPVYNSIGTPSGKKIIKLAQFLEWLPEGCLVNVDRSWAYWKDDALYSIIRQSGKGGQLFFKSPVEASHLEALSTYGADFNYVPILKSREEFERVTSYSEIQLVGVELVVSDLEDDLLDKEWLHQLKEKGLFTVANGENLGEDFNLFGGLNDDTVLLGEHSWDDFIACGIDVIQTDWPNFASAYREALQSKGDVSES